MEISFKPAGAADRDRLLVFMREFYEFERLPLDESVARAALEQILNNDSLGRVWLIHVGEEAVGYVVLTLGFSLEFHGRDAFIDELYVRAGHRGQGVGTRTLRFIEKVCPTLGVQALHLEVARTNTPAQNFYRKLGFVDHDRYLLTKWMTAGSKREPM